MSYLVTINVLSYSYTYLEFIFKKQVIFDHLGNPHDSSFSISFYRISKVIHVDADRIFNIVLLVLFAITDIWILLQYFLIAGIMILSGKIIVLFKRDFAVLISILEEKIDYLDLPRSRQIDQSRLDGNIFPYNQPVS